jgi:hypothetical protein
LGSRARNYSNPLISILSVILELFWLFASTDYTVGI